MCGILGSIDIKLSEEQLDLIKHRGPDDSGLISIPGQMHRLWLGHRRLSIVDLSPAGHQPMSSDCGNYTLIFNGEIYNHEEIRKTLNQQQFRGHSDTETILYALKENGIKAAEKFNGIFAFAFVDLLQQKLLIARDFFGVKPLYYSSTSDGFLFSSELRPIKSIIKNISIDSNSLSTLLRLRYVPSPYTLYKNIYKVRPGHFIEVDLSKERINPNEQALTINDSKLFSGSFDDAVDQYNELFSASVKRQLMSDVEIGIMLSGGVDSAMVASIAAKNGSRQTKAFTVGYDGKYASDEISDAQETARLLNLEHHIVKISNNDYHDLFAQCVEITEEPTATTSTIPFYCLSKLASEHVKVVLTGQGADEPLGGYFRYKEELLRQKLPNFVLDPFCSLVNNLPIKSEKIRRATQALPIRNDIERFDEAYSIFPYTQIEKLIGKSDNRSLEAIQYNYDLYKAKNLPHSAFRMMKIDARMNLADDLLNYTDKISMHFALETRVPILDTELVSFIESLPLSYKVNLFKGKIAHKKNAEKILPGNIINRPKKDFKSPTNEWFRNDIGTIGDLLTQSNTKFASFFDRLEINRTLELHKKGYNMEKQLFLLLSIYYWLEKS
ncbi:asparagine synthase (glutamine-hydrolyzing) [Cyclobacterium plantarum]|uniref:asparagine synthase (glutamine-hydrolyzing) n=1 Tax=Cyclobacterium plantarum TaxID=2716263 RepID=A0ABX0H644_9BACT|nr:asparagine synthase (glutamine-hydrolyzing) [Cyclobacterium plantarum]NHE57114.1 asparagine synthase (glutamine-hydrolyzing) [Cyclobacterium plantarum]